MKLKRIVIIVSMCLAIVLASLYTLTHLIFGPGGGRGSVIDHWEVANKNFKIRITEYEEQHPVWLHRFNYVFETSFAVANDWRELIDTWTDDDIPIPHDSARLLSDAVGYVNMGESFAATTDEGRTWSVWDAKQKVPNWQCCNQAFIKEVHIASNGKGEMILSPRFNQIPITQLYTNDFGMNWNAQ